MRLKMYDVDNRALWMNHSNISIDEVFSVISGRARSGVVETEAAKKKEAYGLRWRERAQNLYSALLLLVLFAVQNFHY